jgi:plastocyanin
MTRCGTVLGAGALVALLAGCGGTTAPPAAASSSGSSTTTSAMETSENTSCAPNGTTLKLVAKDTRFDTECLAAPAGEAVTLTLDNEDTGIAHNVEIFTADPDKDKNARSVFKGDLVTGVKTMAYSVPALTAGNYHFHCDVHPTQMYGTLVVK